MTSPGLFRKRPRTCPARAPRALPRVEPLEHRTVPYSASGNLWPHQHLITLSFQPDGTDLGGVASNLFSTFNAAFGSASAWQNAILKAAQTWAQQADVNFTVVSDSGAASGTGNYQQGDANFGDVRIGGFDFGDSSILAMAYMPPPVNNYSVAGDVAFNTAQVFNINGLDYDLYTVALHELGHALGLNHSTSTSAILYPIYQGVEPGLYADDVAGIQSIYGARVSDAYDAAPADGTFATASNVTSQIDPTTLTAVLTGLDMTTTSDKDYYQFTVPSGGGGTLALTVQSTGLSLLAPSVKVYDAGQHQLATATGSGEFGSTLSLNVSVTAGQTYYIRVAGANTSAFGTGAYGLTLNFGTGASPTLPVPNTQTANGNPLSGGGGVAEHTGGSEDYDLLTTGDGRFEPRNASAGATLPQQGIAPAALPSFRPAQGLVPPTAAVPAPQDRPVTAAWGARGAAVPGVPLLPPLNAGGVATAPQDVNAAGPVPELPTPPAESDAPLGLAPSPAACDACFSAADWREDHPAAGAVSLPHAGGPADGAAEAVEPAAVVALAAVLGSPWGGRPAAADSRRRPALPG